LRQIYPNQSTGNMATNNEFGRWQQTNHFWRVVVKTLTMPEVLVLGEILQHADINGQSNIKIPDLIRMLPIKERCIKEAISTLKSRGLLESKHGKNGYTVLVGSWQKDSESKVHHHALYQEEQQDTKVHHHALCSNDTEKPKCTTMHRKVHHHAPQSAPPCTFSIYTETEYTECSDSVNRNVFDCFKEKKKEQPQDDPMAEWDMMVATRLKNAAARVFTPTHRSVKSIVLTAGADQIRLMRTKDNISPKRIECVLDWYISQMRDQKAFQCFSGATFREKFPRMELRLRYNIRYLGLDLEPDADATDAHSRLITLGWPKCSGDDLYKAYQISRNRYKDFRKRITEYAATLKPWREYSELREQSLARLVAGLPDKMPASSSYTEQYFKNTVFPRVAKWEKWDGNLAAFLIDPDGKDFQQQGRVWSKEITGSEKWWNELMDEINKDAEVCK
jgi:DNA-binding IscR family transcriptional regulator